MTRHRPGVYVDGRGHKEVRDGSESLKLHRLVAYAHGIIDGLDDPRHVHHTDDCKANNGPENLTAEHPDDHSRITRSRQLRRQRAAADGGTRDGEPIADGGTILAGPSKMERCDGCGTMTAEPSRYGRVAAGCNPYTVVYCTTCETLRKRHDIRPERHTQYRLPEEVGQR